MKKSTKKILSLLLTLVLLVGVLPGMSAFAEPQTWPSGDTTVTYNDDTHILTVSGTGAMADYASSGQVPWRDYRSYIQSVVINDGVTSIGMNAFRAFYNMTSVSIPGSVTSIGMNAFYQCMSLTSVSIPSSVTSISQNAFYGCTSLTSVSIPSSVTSISNGAFFSCTSLTSVVIPNGVTSIDAYAFSGCPSLTSLVIPNGVTSIGIDAFRSCSGLNGTNLNIPGSVTSIGNGAFRGVNFTSVTFEPGVNGATLTIGDKAFDNESTTLAYGSGNAKLYDENGDEVAAGMKMNTLGNKTLTWKSTGFTMTFQPGRGTGVDQQLPATAGADYQLPDGNNMFTAPEGEVFDCWKDTDTGVTYKAMATIPNVSKNYTLEAQWKDASQGRGSRGGLSTNGADVVFNIPGAGDGWEYIGGGVLQRAYRLSFAPMQGGSAYFLLTSGENGETMNVYPQSSVRVVATPAPGYRVASIVWSMIDGSASYDITESQTFVMPAMDAVVYVTFQPVA